MSEQPKLEKFAISTNGHGSAVYVKEWQFFVEQGGLREPWGKNWLLIEAESIDDARKRGKKLMGKLFELLVEGRESK